jgi:hypothetical protein
VYIYHVVKLQRNLNFFINYWFVPFVLFQNSQNKNDKKYNNNEA